MVRGLRGENIMCILYTPRAQKCQAHFFRPSAGDIKKIFDLFSLVCRECHLDRAEPSTNLAERQKNHNGGFFDLVRPPIFC